MASRSEALRLAGGVPVFPCGVDKRPLVPHGFHDASIDADQIRRWWTRWPNALIGVPTGPRFVVIDADLQHPEAQEWFAAAELPETRTHFTRSGGRHLLFQPHEKVGCSTGKIWKHVDSRGLGGYVIWWPAEGLPVQNSAVLAPVPDAIVAALKSPPPPPKPSRRGKTSNGKLAGILRTIALAHEGQRNAVTFWGACRLAELVAEGALSDSQAIALVIEAASRAGLPPMEATRTAQSALRRTA
jgi:putative DNA primase/helicase